MVNSRNSGQRHSSGYTESLALTFTLIIAKYTFSPPARSTEEPINTLDVSTEDRWLINP